MSPATRDTFHKLLEAQVSNLNRKLAAIVGSDETEANLTLNSTGKLGLVILNEPLEPERRYRGCLQNILNQVDHFSSKLTT